MLTVLHFNSEATHSAVYVENLCILPWYVRFNVGLPPGYDTYIQNGIGTLIYRLRPINDVQ